MEPPPQPSAAPPLPPPPSPPSSPPPPQTHDTTLTLALALPPPALSPKPNARRPRPEGGARVRCSPTGDTPPCTECGKRFPSWKALFGHMRCHPERQWRGITPPSHFDRHGATGASAGQFTVQERDVAASLLMLSGARTPGAACKGKKNVVTAAASPSAIDSCGTSASAPPGPANCDDHRCSVCDRGFSSGQALGGHKRCHWERACGDVGGHKRFHWERACGDVAAIAPAGSSASTMSEAAAVAAVLDLNLPPPGPPPVRKNDQGSSMNAMLDLKLGY